MGRLGLSTLVTVALLGCRTTPTTPGADGPAAIAELPDETRDAIRAALARANEDGGRWRVAEAFVYDGVALERYELAGGPAVLLVGGPHRDVVTHQVWFSTGAKDGSFGSVEAMLAVLRPASAGEVDAAVSWDASYWSTTVEASALEDTIGSSAQRLSSGVSKDEAAQTFRRWRSSKLVWNRRRLDHEFERTAAQRFGQPIKTAASFAERLERHFDARRATIVVAGDFERASALRAIARAYPARESLSDSASTDTRTGQTPKVPLELRTPSATRRAFVWWPTKGANVEAQVALNGVAHVVANRVLTELAPHGARSSLVRVRSGRAGAFSVEIELAETLTATKSAELVRSVIRRVGRGETTGIEIERAQARLEVEHGRQLASLEGRARLSARAWIERGSLHALVRSLAVVSTISERDLRRAAKEHLSVAPVIVVGRASSEGTP